MQKKNVLIGTKIGGIVSGNKRLFEGRGELVCVCVCVKERESARMRQGKRDAALRQICLQSASCLQGTMITKKHHAEMKRQLERQRRSALEAKVLGNKLITAQEMVLCVCASRWRSCPLWLEGQRKITCGRTIRAEDDFVLFFIISRPPVFICM